MATTSGTFRSVGVRAIAATAGATPAHSRGVRPPMYAIAFCKCGAHSSQWSDRTIVGDPAGLEGCHLIALRRTSRNDHSSSDKAGHGLMVISQLLSESVHDPVTGSQRFGQTPQSRRCGHRCSATNPDAQTGLSGLSISSTTPDSSSVDSLCCCSEQRPCKLVGGGLQFFDCGMDYHQCLDRLLVQQLRA